MLHYPRDEWKTRRPKTTAVTGRRYTGKGIWENQYAGALVACLALAREHGDLKPEELPMAALTLEERMQDAIRQHVGVTYMVPGR